MPDPVQPDPVQPDPVQPDPVQHDVPGAFVDSFENMPGDQPLDDTPPTKTDLERPPGDGRPA